MSNHGIQRIVSDIYWWLVTKNTYSVLVLVLFRLFLFFSFLFFMFVLKLCTSHKKKRNHDMFWCSITENTPITCTKKDCSVLYRTRQLYPYTVHVYKITQVHTTVVVVTDHCTSSPVFDTLFLWEFWLQKTHVVTSDSFTEQLPYHHIMEGVSFEKVHTSARPPSHDCCMWNEYQYQKCTWCCALDN